MFKPPFLGTPLVPLLQFLSTQVGGFFLRRIPQVGGFFLRRCSSPSDKLRGFFLRRLAANSGTLYTELVIRISLITITTTITSTITTIINY